MSDDKLQEIKKKLDIKENPKRKIPIRDIRKFVAINSYLIANIGVSGGIGYLAGRTSASAYPYGIPIRIGITGILTILIQSGWKRLVYGPKTKIKKKTLSTLLIAIFGILAGIFSFLLGLYYGFGKTYLYGYNSIYGVYKKKRKNK